MRNSNCHCGTAVPSEFYQIEANVTAINNNPPYPDPSGSGYWMIYNPAKKQYEPSDVKVPVYSGNIDIDAIYGGDSTNFESGTHDKILTAHVRSRSDTEANWAANDPLLELGEFGLTTDGENKGRFKIGDGVNSWSALKYYGENGASGDYVTMGMIESGKAPLPIKALSQDDGTVLVLDGGDADDLSV